MPTADATILPPPPFDDRGSVRHLDEVGVDTVLGSLLEQKRRASESSPPAVEIDDRGRPPPARFEPSSRHVELAPAAPHPLIDACAATLRLVESL